MKISTFGLSFSYWWLFSAVPFAAQYEEWHQLVPQLISGDIKKLTKVVDAHHRRENMLASLRSR